MAGPIGNSRRAVPMFLVPIVLAALLTSWLLVVERAGASSHVKTFTFDSAAGNDGAPCSIVFEGKDDDSETRTDVQSAYSAFEQAIAGSADMRAKVKDACSKNGDLTIHIGKNMKNTANGGSVVVGAAETGGNEVWIDPGDFSVIQSALSGKTPDTQKIMDNIWISLLAHEIDHLRHTDTENHKDPDPSPAKSPDRSGPAVADENRVNAELKSGIARNNYFVPITYTVDGQAVTLDIKKAIDDASTAGSSVDPVAVTLDAFSVQVIQLTWAPISLQDSDFDGVTDDADNSPDIFNPNQNDVDNDGTPQVEDEDDDADGQADTLEEAAGADSMNTQSTPEHWAVPETCGNQLDDDRDGLTDDADAACTAPPMSTDFPTLATDAYPFLFQDHYRKDLGGVKDAYDILPVGLSMSLDVSAISPDANAPIPLEAEGTVVVRRDSTVVREGLPEVVPVELVAMELRSVAPVTVYPGLPTAPTITIKPGSGSHGELADPAPGKPNFPVDSFFDIDYEIDFGGNNAIKCTACPVSGILVTWPPIGGVVTADSHAQLRNTTGDVVASGQGIKLTFEGTDLRLEKMVDVTPVAAGEYQTYTVRVDNDGTLPAAGVSFTDILSVSQDAAPGSLSTVLPTIVSTTITQGSCKRTVDFTKGIKTVCTLGSIDPGEGVTVETKTVPRSPANYMNTAVVQSAYDLDYDHQNNRKSVNTLATAWGGCTIYGTPGNDNLWGTAANDVMCGGKGNDLFHAGKGDDTYQGGAGLDHITFASASNAVRVNMATSRASGWGADRLYSIEKATGSSYADTFFGSGGSNYFLGGPGNDLFYPGGGNDTVAGQSGSDGVSYSNAGSRVAVNLTLNVATGQGTDKFSSIENVTGSNFNDSIKGNGSANRLYGLKGSDQIFGLGGADRLYGSSGIDYLYGGAGNDYLDGGLNADTCRQGTGAGKKVNCEK